ncbi:Yip1 domain-containing protein [Aliiroseovarius halocynthiae]|uniref:YIP1 family protein n=1 Tax=Aliiroseovarius halocynthiae TaxID=985055 RepID=A0A545SVV9_9RHOB|nr:Yip1 family protein [Aliiroseovarius halocynthiae]TQV69108.1 YIP1 family protein [Aliiroseovarius halocynthiae]SMR71865.1 Yip1 domain-containing protein [Aliiroseovarius halocynthiae]
MQFTPGYLFGMALQTVPEPRKVARDLFALGLSREFLWTALLLMVVLSTCLIIIGSLLPSVGTEPVSPALISPITLGVLNGILTFGMAAALYFVGRLMGGQGNLENAIATVVWAQFMLLGIQALTVVLLLFAPLMAAMLTFASAFISFWVLSHFTAENHGFRSAGLVFASILIFIVLSAFPLSLFLMILGVEPPPLPVQ